MDTLIDIWPALRDHPEQVALCIGFPVALMLVFGTDGDVIDDGGGDGCD